MDTPTQKESSSGEEKLPGSLKNIKDIAKKRLKAISAQNKKLLQMSPTPSLLLSSPGRFKSSMEEQKDETVPAQKVGSTSAMSVSDKPKVPLSLYSDEESDLVKNDEKILETLTEKESGSPVRRIYRTERTHSTSSELSEGEIVDDDDELDAKPQLTAANNQSTAETDKNQSEGVELEPTMESRSSNKLLSEKRTDRPGFFDLRQKLQHRERGGMFRSDVRRPMFGQRGRGRWFRGGRQMNRFDRRNASPLQKRGRSNTRSRSRSVRSRDRKPSKRRKSDSKRKSSEKSKKDKSERKKHKSAKLKLKLEEDGKFGEDNENQLPKKTLKEKLGLGVLKEPDAIEAETDIVIAEKNVDNSEKSSDNLKNEKKKEKHESKKKKQNKIKKHKEKHSKAENKNFSPSTTEVKVKPVIPLNNLPDIDSILSESDEEIKELKRKLKEMRTQLNEKTKIAEEVVLPKDLTPELRDGTIIVKVQANKQILEEPKTPELEKPKTPEIAKHQAVEVIENDTKLKQSFSKAEKVVKAEKNIPKTTTPPKKPVKTDKIHETKLKNENHLNCNVKMINGSTKAFPAAIIKKTKALPAIFYSPRPDILENPIKKQIKQSSIERKSIGPKTKDSDRKSNESKTPAKHDKDIKHDSSKKKIELKSDRTSVKRDSKDPSKDTKRDVSKEIEGSSQKKKEPIKEKERGKSKDKMKDLPKDKQRTLSKDKENELKESKQNSSKDELKTSPKKRSLSRSLSKSKDRSNEKQKYKSESATKRLSTSSNNKQSDIRTLDKSKEKKPVEVHQKEVKSDSSKIVKKERIMTPPKQSLKIDESVKNQESERHKSKEGVKTPEAKIGFEKKISSVSIEHSVKKDYEKDKKILPDNSKPQTHRSRSRSRGKELCKRHSLDDKSADKSKDKEVKNDKSKQKPINTSNTQSRSRSRDKINNQSDSKKVSQAKSNNKNKIKEKRPTLSFIDDLEEVQGLKKLRSKTPSPKESPSKLNKSPEGSDSPDTDEYAANWEDDYSPSLDPGEVHKYRKKITMNHAEMLKEVESKVESILAPLTEIEKLAKERNTMRPEDLINNIMGLVTLDKKNLSAVTTPEHKVASIVEEQKPVILAATLKSNEDEFLVDDSKRIPISFKVGKIDKKVDEAIKPTQIIPVTLPQTTSITEKSNSSHEVLETEYETFINSLISVDPKDVKEGTPPLPTSMSIKRSVTKSPDLSSLQDDLLEKTPTPKKKNSRSVSSSTASTTSTDSTSSSGSTTESSSSSSEDDSSSYSSSNSSSSDSDSSDSRTTTTKTAKKIKKVKKKQNVEPSVPICTEDKTLPVTTVVKSEPVEVQAEAISSTITDCGLIPLPPNRDTPIKIQLSAMQKIHSIKQEVDLDDSGNEPTTKTDSKIKKPEKSDKINEKMNKQKSRSKSGSPKKTDDRRSKSDWDRKRSRSRSNSKDNRNRRRSSSRKRTRSRSRDRYKRRRSISPLRNRRHNSRDRYRRRSPSYSPRRHFRRQSPRRPKSPRTPDSPFRDRSYTPSRNKRTRSPNSSRRSRSPRSASESPNHKRRAISWSRYDDQNRPPSPQSDTESPVAGFKRSLADSTISDAELENQQQLYKIQTHMANEGFFSYMDPDGQFTVPGESDSPKRLSLDERINIALEHPEPPKYGYQPPDDYAYRYNFSNANNIPMHSHGKIPYQYDPRFGPPQGTYPLMPGNIPQSPFVQQQTNYHMQNMMQTQNRRTILPQTSSGLISVRTQPSPQCNVVQKGNVLEIVPEELQPMKVPEPKVVTETPVPAIYPLLLSVKQKVILTTEELRARKDKKLELKKKRKTERDKKRLEKKMRKEKLKLEIKRLVSMGVKDDDLSSEEDAPFDDITKKGMYGTKDKGILKEEGVTKPVKKMVKFADGILPGDGSSYSDDDDTSPLGQQDVEKKKKSKKKRQRPAANNVNEKKQVSEPLLAVFPTPPEQIIPPELENAPPPPPPEGNPPANLPQPRFLYPNRVPMLFFHLLRPQQLSVPMPPHHMPPGPNAYHHAGAPNLPPHLSSAPPMNMVLPPPQVQSSPIPPPIINNKLTPTSRMNQLPPTFGANIKV